MNNFSKNKKIALLCVLITALIFFIIVFSYKDKVHMKKILSSKYDSVNCIGKNCDGFYASIKEKNKNKVKLFDNKGKLVSNYSYDNSEKKIDKPYFLTSKYLLTKKEISKEENEYSIYNLNYKRKYKTKNELSHINDYIVLETKEADMDYQYNIISNDGNIILRNVTDFEMYDEGKALFLKKDGKSFICDEKGKRILSGYLVYEEKEDYLILKNIENNKYYFFNLDKLEIENEEFTKYIIYSDDSIEVLRDFNNTVKASLIKKNGKEVNSIKGGFVFDIRESIKKDIKNKYSLYETSVYSNSTTKVFVDSKENNSFGIYDIKEKTYKKLYSYLVSDAYSEVIKIESKDNKPYIQAICNKPMCEKDRTYIFDSEKGEILFTLESDSDYIEEFNYYSNGYKVIKYTRKSSDDLKNKYVIYDKNNKIIEKYDNPVVILGTKLLFGNDYDKVLLYNVKTKKVINDDDNLAILKDEKYYLYSSTVVDLNGKKLYSSSKNYSLLYFNNYAYLVNEREIKLYNFNEDNVYKYKMTKNESNKMKNKESMVPFRSIIFVNNDKKNYAKIINTKSNSVKKLKNEEIFSITMNEDYTKLYLITIKNDKKNIKYGLYIMN